MLLLAKRKVILADNLEFYVRTHEIVRIEKS